MNFFSQMPFSFPLADSPMPPLFLWEAAIGRLVANQCPYLGGSRLSSLDSRRGLLRSPSGAASHFPQNEATGSNAVHASRSLGRMENTVRHFRTVNLLLRKFAPCKGEIPRSINLSYSRFAQLTYSNCRHFHDILFISSNSRTNNLW